MSNPVVEEILSIENFLGKERVEDLKDFVVEKLKENFEDSINNNWVVVPNSFNEFWDSIFKKAYKNIMKEYENKLSDAMVKRMESYIKKEVINITEDDSK